MRLAACARAQQDEPTARVLRIAPGGFYNRLIAITLRRGAQWATNGEILEGVAREGPDIAVSPQPLVALDGILLENTAAGNRAAKIRMAERNVASKKACSAAVRAERSGVSVSR